jgi:hypothetical protein
MTLIEPALCSRLIGAGHLSWHIAHSRPMERRWRFLCTLPKRKKRANQNRALSHAMQLPATR